MEEEKKVPHGGDGDRDEPNNQAQTGKGVSAVLFPLNKGEDGTGDDEREKKDRKEKGVDPMSK